MGTISRCKFTNNFFNYKKIVKIFFLFYLCIYILKSKIKMEKLGYSAQIQKIEAILAKIENGETDVDELASEIKRASQLLQECKEKLLRTEQEVEKIMKIEE